MHDGCDLRHLKKVNKRRINADAIVDSIQGSLIFKKSSHNLIGMKEEAITAKMVESGEMDRWKELLRSRLVECGWRDQVRLLCRESLKQQGSIENTTVDQIVAEITPKARGLVPDAVKIELLMKIKTFLQQETTIINE